MRTREKRISQLVIFLTICLLAPLAVCAANGAPGSPNFGYGARLDIHGPQVETAIQIASQLDLDWLALDFDWSALWLSPEVSPDFGRLDAVMSLVKAQELAILVSITNPPDWSLSPKGPNPDLTAELATLLAQRYQPVLSAIELFPGANTQKGWGVDPDPQDYANLVRAVHNSLQEVNPEITIVAGGFDPLTKTKADIDELAFLEGMYKSGASTFMPVVGIRLPNIRTIPTQSPRDTSDFTLRHYEAVREIMLQNNHQNGLIWVTGFSWDNRVVSTPEDQAIWLKQAFLMMRAQLYIGTAFVGDMAPFSNATTNAMVSINAAQHPGIDAIRQIIAWENSRYTQTFEIILLKSAINELAKNR